MRWMTIAAGLTMLTGCIVEDDMDTTSPQDACDAGGYVSLVGTNAAAVSFPRDKNVRIIGPDTPVTRDYRLDRLNVYVNSAGIITSVDCG